MLLLMMMCLATVGKAQVRAMPNTQKDYYLYSFIEVRWADKANGEQCFVILMSPRRKWTAAFKHNEDSRWKSHRRQKYDGRISLFRGQWMGTS